MTTIKWTSWGVGETLSKNNIWSYVWISSNNGLEALKVLLSRLRLKNQAARLARPERAEMSSMGFLLLRADPSLAQTSVVVLTTSKDERDKVAAYNLNVAGYLLKPVEFIDFVRPHGNLEDKYWTLVELP